MKKSPTSFPFRINIAGTEYSARYTVASNLVTVHYGLDSKTTQIGGSGAEVIAGMLLQELVASARANGSP